MSSTAAQRYPPITIRRLTLHNIKCFRHVTLTFENGDGSGSWTLLVGDNGVGKTTILQCISLCALGPELAAKILRQPQNMLRDGSEKGYMEAVFDAPLEAVEETDDAAGDVVIRIDIEKGKRTFSAPLKKKETIEKQNRLHLLGAKALRDFPASRRDPDIVSLARDRMYRLMESGADVKGPM
jgi:predicted ATP-binding protein involved in virulence